MHIHNIRMKDLPNFEKARNVKKSTTSIYITYVSYPHPPWNPRPTSPPP